MSDEAGAQADAGWREREMLRMLDALRPAECRLCGSPSDGPCLHDDAVALGWNKPRPIQCARWETSDGS